MWVRDRERGWMEVDLARTKWREERERVERRLSSSCSGSNLAQQLRNDAIHVIEIFFASFRLY